jgi:hypothetical protein
MSTPIISVLNHHDDAATTIWPWGPSQEWALRDALPKYTVPVPAENNAMQQVVVLWRTMVRETPELAGYPLDDLIQRASAEDDNQCSTQLLPYLDNYQFESNGGVVGQVQGLPGIADDTYIHTTPVHQLAQTMPRGLLWTTTPTDQEFNSLQRGIWYELGRPRLAISETDGLPHGDDTDLGRNLPVAAATSNSVPLWAILAATGVGGVTVANLLSHHLTIQVFWV